MPFIGNSNTGKNNNNGKGKVKKTNKFVSQNTKIQPVTSLGTVRTVKVKPVSNIDKIKFILFTFALTSGVVTLTNPNVLGQQKYEISNSLNLRDSTCLNNADMPKKGVGLLIKDNSFLGIPLFKYTSATYYNNCIVVAVDKTISVSRDNNNEVQIPDGKYFLYKSNEISKEIGKDISIRKTIKKIENGKEVLVTEIPKELKDFKDEDINYIFLGLKKESDSGKKFVNNLKELTPDELNKLNNFGFLFPESIGINKVPKLSIMVRNNSPLIELHKNNMLGKGKVVVPIIFDFK